MRKTWRSNHYRTKDYLFTAYRRLKITMFRGLDILIMSAAANIEFLLNSIKNEKIKFLLYTRRFCY